MTTKRPTKTKLELVDFKLAPKNLIFDDGAGSRTRKSFYKDKLIDAAQKEQFICILKEDTYLLSQFKVKAKKLKLQLAFAEHGDNLYIKVMLLEGEMKKLFLWLREFRTFNELKGKNLELDLQNSLDESIKKGIVVYQRDKLAYRLTDEGVQMLMTAK